MSIVQIVCSVAACGSKARSKGLCGKHYQRLRTHGDVNSVKQIHGDNKKRLMSAVEISASGCWEWRKATDDSGYGIVTVRGRQEKAHRAFWSEFVGEIPELVRVIHKCHNRSCVNPDHLFLGSQADCLRYMVEDGRENRAYGERVGGARLTEEQVLEIRLLIATGQPLTEIAKIYDIADTTIGKIKREQSWGWLE